MAYPIGKLTRISPGSVRFKLVLGVLVLVVPLIGLLIYSNFYAATVIRNQVAVSNKNLMSLYMQQFDRTLQSVDEYLLGLAGADSGLADLEYSESDFDRYNAIRRLTLNVNSNLINYPALGGLFVYSSTRDEYITAFRSNTELEQRLYMQSYIEQEAAKPDTALEWFNRGWFIHQTGESAYLIRLMKLENTYVGAWLGIDQVALPLPLIYTGADGGTLFADDAGTPLTMSQFVQKTGVQIRTDLETYYLTGADERYLAVGEHSSKGSFSLIAFIPEEQILEKLPALQRLTGFISVGAIALLPVCLLLLRKVLLIPLNRLMQAMNRIKDGNLEVRIPPFRTSEEFVAVRDTFNSMMSQIQELRISVYEEKLNKQKAELQHLQLQLNPHFFINSLNMMHMLARNKNVALMEEMSLCLVHYFRYMFRSNLTFVTLGEELQHVRNYLRIQELRFPGYLQTDIAVPDFLLRTPVPPLIIQTFVENTVKHAVTLDEPILLTVAIELEEQESERFRITIQDSGKGFSEEVLREINKGNRVVDDEGEHIGIWNVRQRLLLLYAERARIAFGNVGPTGACIRIGLPLQPEQREEER